MTWINDLYESYDTIENLPFEVRKDLIPVAHSTQNAQIEIHIDEDGNFIRALSVTKEEQVTIIPVTEDSGTRSGTNPPPHPLHDKLKYVAGDFGNFVDKCNPQKFEQYLELLADWCNSDYSNPKIQAIYEYVAKASLLKDLINCGLFNLEDGKLAQDKINGIDASECFVRFDVKSNDIFATDDMPLYKDFKVYNLYTSYYIASQMLQETSKCYVTGNETFCSTKHPAKIRNTGDKSKLISANDSSGFTYKGRLLNSEQVANVSFDVSQKVHNTLRWLLANQGFHIGDLYIVAWEKSHKKIISIMKSTEDALFDDNSFFDNDDVEDIATTNISYGKRVASAAKGYKANLDTNAEIMVMGVDAATTGRLSVVFYEKFNGSQFMDNILNWHKTFYWKYNYKKWNEESKKYDYRKVVGAPSPKEIAIVAFGDKNDNAIKDTIERLLPCIVEGKRLPKDIMITAFMRASNRHSVDSRNEYENNVAITCGLIRKYRHDYFEEEWDMALDKTITDRNYLFGRLLGAAQKLESVALFYSGEKDRSTAAERYSQQFAKKPAKTWVLINDALKPYEAKLKSMGKTYYVKELQEIYDLINPEDFVKQESLNELYLLGYNCQLNSYNKFENIENIEKLNSVEEEF